MAKKYDSFHYWLVVHEIIARIISIIESSLFSDFFITWMKGVKMNTQNKIIAVDGKTMKRSYNKKEKLTAIHM